ncbi:isochorismatase family protein [Cysteiniphilum halobium]|uniref:isochorismatase family protein n=1 Tax=Cysteiniphilum halobium TaxID=2219059 RepID=UPI000E651448|nr:isochorismatase family protein [Cysteiniphilum halobium]
MNYDVDLCVANEYNSSENTINTASAALLIIEMQNVFKGEIISGKQISNVKKLIKFAEDKKMKKIFVRHNDSSDTSNNMIAWWGGDQIIKGSKEWEIMDEFDASNDIIVDKSQYSAFYQTNLEDILKENKITDLIVCGVMTNCCCETTTRDAFMRGYNVFFINDATGTINSELHEAAIKNISFGFARVLNTGELTSIK